MTGFGRSFEGVLTRRPLAVHTVVCQFGLLEAAEEAARASTSQSYGYLARKNNTPRVRTLLCLLVSFSREKVSDGRASRISASGRPCIHGASTKHWNDRLEHLYSNLTKGIVESFIRGSCAERENLLAFPFKIAGFTKHNQTFGTGRFIILPGAGFPGVGRPQSCNSGEAL